MPFWRNHGPMQHVTTGARPGTKVLFLEAGVYSSQCLCYEPHVIPSCLIFLQQDEDKENKCAWIKSIDGV